MSKEEKKTEKERHEKFAIDLINLTWDLIEKKYYNAI